MKEEILNYIGELMLYGGSSVAIAYTVFVFIGKKWMDNRFSKELQKHKNKLDGELEDVKFKIKSLFNRATKIHEKEFEILPEAWNRLYDTFVAMIKWTSPLQEYADLEKMENEEIDEFLNKTPFSELEKNKIRSSKNKNEFFRDLVLFYKKQKAIKEINQFHSYIQRNRIFLSENLKNSFTMIDDKIWEAYSKMEGNYDTQGSREYGNERYSAWKSIKNDVNLSMQEIEKLVQERLHFFEVE